MFPLGRQIEIACDFAKGVSARLAQADMPNFDDTETTLAEYKARIANTIALKHAGGAHCQSSPVAIH